MQKLHMSEENPELMKTALLDIRGDLKLRQASMYRYGLKDNQLLVKSSED